MPKGIKPGDRAPVFRLLSQSGEEVDLRDYIGRKPVVLYFYPKDNTTVCTKEACAFRDNLDEFAKIDNAEVIGISSDSVDSHNRFSAEHNLPFKLLSDEEGKVRELYGVPKTLGLLPGRVTYVIDREGTVRHVFSSQLDYKKHVQEALRSLKNIGEE